MAFVPSSTDGVPFPPDLTPPVVGNSSIGAFSPAVTTAKAAQESENQRLASLRQQLAQTQEELASLQTLMESLPEIFEQKFQERVGPMLKQRQRLLEHNTALRENLHQLAPSASAGDAISTRGSRPRLRAALRHAFGLDDPRTVA